MVKLAALAAVAALLHAASAKTDLAGCTSSTTVDAYNNPALSYYVPGTGEICSIPE